MSRLWGYLLFFLPGKQKSSKGVNKEWHCTKYRCGKGRAKYRLFISFYTDVILSVSHFLLGLDIN